MYASSLIQARRRITAQRAANSSAAADQVQRRNIEAAQDMAGCPAFPLPCSAGTGRGMRTAGCYHARRCGVLPGMPHLRLASLSTLVLAACSGSGGPTDTVVARATIGPDGGEVRVADGPLAGVVLTVPAGALAAPVELRIVRFGDPAHAFPGALAVRLGPSAGEVAEPLRVEPEAQEFANPARLRFVYAPLQILDT